MSKKSSKEALYLTSSGKMPRFVKVPLDNLFPGRKSLIQIVGYDIFDVAVQRNTKTVYVIFKKGK